MALPFGLKTGLTAKTIVTTAVDPADPSKGNHEVEYGARCMAHAVVYQLNGKPIKNDLVQDEIKAQLIGTMLAGAGAEAEAVIEAPLETPTIIDEAADYTPEQLADAVVPRVTGGTIITGSTEKSANPFVQEPAATYDESVNEAMRVAKELEAHMNQVPNPQFAPSQFENVESIADDLGFDAADAPVIDYEALLAEAEARSIDTVNLKVLIDALYRRFHVYLPYLNIPPQRTDISPTTGMVMNAITFGQAVQGFKAAQRSGASWNPQVIRTQLESSRSSTAEPELLPMLPEEAAQDIQPYNGQDLKMPNLHGEPEDEPPIRVNRAYDSPHLSAQYSARGKETDGLDEDEMYAEPPINAQNAVIRPFYPNKASQAKLEEINRQRTSTIPQNTGFSDLV